MNKKLIITCSLITILLAGFPHVLYAEDAPQDFEGGYTTHYGNISELDSYFYDNFILLPYLESTGSQYINTGYYASNNSRINLIVSNVEYSNSTKVLFGAFSSSGSKLIATVYRQDLNKNLFVFNSSEYTTDSIYVDNYLYNIDFDRNNIYINGDLINTYPDASFNTSITSYIFARNSNNQPQYYSNYRLYYCQLSDYDSINDEYIVARSFYPAKQKSNGSYGLYDAVNKIFYVSNSGTPFENPEGSDVELSLLSRIGLWLRTSLGSISEIFTYIVTEPIIMFFMAVGLAGAMYRWARRLVHF